MTLKSYPYNVKDTTLTFDTREKHFILYLDNYSCFKDNPKDIRRAFGKARNVPSVKAMDAWAVEMLDIYSNSSTDKDDQLRAEIIRNEGFGPESHE